MALAVSKVDTDCRCVSKDGVRFACQFFLIRNLCKDNPTPLPNWSSAAGSIPSLAVVYAEARLGAGDLLPTGKEVARCRPVGMAFSWHESDCFEGGFNRRSLTGLVDSGFDWGRRLFVGIDSVAFVSSEFANLIFGSGIRADGDE